MLIHLHAKHFCSVPSRYLLKGAHQTCYVCSSVCFDPIIGLMSFLVFQIIGTVGDWKNYFTAAKAKEMDDKLLAPLKAVDLNFTDT